MITQDQMLQKIVNHVEKQVDEILVSCDRGPFEREISSNEILEQVKILLDQGFEISEIVESVLDMDHGLRMNQVDG